MEENLRAIGYDLGWLRGELSRKNLNQQEIFWMTGVPSGKTNVIKKVEKP